MFTKRTIRSIDVTGKRVLVRVDLNVPLDGQKVTNLSKIEEIVSTIDYLLDKQARIILMSHLGRPGGKFDKTLVMDPVAAALSSVLKRNVAKVDDCIGAVAEQAVAGMTAGQILLLENLRFYPEEEANDPGFAKKLASLGDIYVNDGFAVSHRAHASTVGVTKFLPSAAGFALEHEVEMIDTFLTNPPGPFWLVIGGAKVSTKVGILKALMDKVDGIIIGGAMANTFLAADGMAMGSSMYEKEALPTAVEVMKLALDKKKPLVLPSDVIVAESTDSTNTRSIAVTEVGPLDMALDIGPLTVATFRNYLRAANTVLWNGPMGLFEKQEFAPGTFEVGLVFADVSKRTLIAGSDTIAAIDNLGLRHKYTYISTGGGATLEYIEGKPLPGIAALPDKAAA
jgi:phosphoglycerate kinase